MEVKKCLIRVANPTCNSLLIPPPPSVDFGGAVRSTVIFAVSVLLEWISIAFTGKAKARRELQHNHIDTHKIYDRKRSVIHPSWWYVFCSVSVRSSIVDIPQKIKMISRSLDNHLPSSSTAPHPLQRNLAPHMHPFAKPREYTRALNAAKIDRMFAKPFVSALGGHQDGVYVLGADPRRASVVAAGGGDGEVIVHSLSQRRALLKLDAHKGMVGGLCWTAEARDGKRGLITAGKLDGQIKIWRSSAFAPGITVEEEEEDNMLDTAGAVGEDGFDEDDLAMDDKATTRGANLEPSLVISSKNGFNSLDHHRSDGVFATASSCVQIWDETRTAPLSTLSFGGSMETVSCVRFNQSETSVLASVGNERTMCLYDVRTGKAERRIVMNMRSNQLSWCPTLPTVMLLASEDHNLYTYDLRNLDRPTQIYKGHVGGVMACDWSKYNLCG